MSTAPWVDERLPIPDLLRAAPQARRVLDRYGLRGCGGRWGPAESLGYFARAHGVAVGQLLDEVRSSAAVGPGDPPAPSATPDRWAGMADAIYKPFFKAGIVLVLTLGAAWGAYLLVRIGWTGSFQAAGLHEVNAHGHAQIFGWVGLFVMGFAYQAFPRFKHAALAHPRLAYAGWGFMLLGIVLRSVLEPLAPAYPLFLGPTVAGAALEVLAAGLFAWVVWATLRRSGKPLEGYDGYVLCALSWFVLQAVYEAVYLAATLNASGPALVALVATWQAPLRDFQIHGFALLMILGVSQRLLHPVFGLPAPAAGGSTPVLLGLNAAVLGEASGLVLMRIGGHAWAALWYGSVLVLTAATVWLVAGCHLTAPAADRDRSLKFIRAAYLWLLVSLGMLVLLPAYQYGLLPRLAPDSDAARIGFSHAYYGAIRHAITVGFVSLMIVGVAAKVVPTLNGVDPRTLSSLWAPFILLNLGCGLRVVGQTLTDFTPQSFPFTAVSGLLEVTGLLLWGVHLWSIMAGRAGTAPPEEVLLPGQLVTPAHRVGEVLAAYPELLPTFLAHGFKPLANPLLRRTVARHVSLERACRLLGMDAAPLVADLNAARGRRGPRSPWWWLARRQLLLLGGFSCGSA
jgi:hypothetical protein